MLLAFDLSVLIDLVHAQPDIYRLSAKSIAPRGEPAGR
jgi:hypothetical protein